MILISSFNKNLFSREKSWDYQVLLLGWPNKLSSKVDDSREKNRTADTGRLSHVAKVMLAVSTGSIYLVHKQTADCGPLVSS